MSTTMEGVEAESNLEEEKEEGEGEEVGEEEIKVYLKVIKTIPMKVKRCNTIGELKVKFQASEGGALSFQEPFFSGNHLKDSDILANSGIRNGSTLNMYVNYGSGMQIFVEMPTGKSISLQVKSWDTVQDVKTKIQEVESIPAYQQTLIYNGRPLEDYRPILSYGITVKSILHVVSHKDGMHIFISMPDGEAVMFEVKNWYTIRDLKTMIKSKRHTSQWEQLLVCNGEQLTDSLTLADYHIQNGSTIQLLLQPGQVLVKVWDGKTITLESHADDTVNVVMNRLQQKIGKTSDHCYLVFSGKRLSGERALVDYNIEYGSTINLVARSHS